jgi:hypothetical protein
MEERNRIEVVEKDRGSKTEGGGNRAEGEGKQSRRRRETKQ